MTADLLAHFERIADAPDAIQRLRQFILDLAVRGKLVPQDEDDEPASALVKAIAAEKSRLTKERAIRKERDLPAVGPDEAPFAIPRSWQWVRIRAVTSDRGQTVPTHDFTYIDVTAINKDTGSIEEPRLTSAAEAPSRARKIVRKGDVIYSCVRPYLLNVAVVDRDLSPPPIASTAFAVLNGFGLLEARYLWLALRSPALVDSVEAKMRGQAYPAINDSDFALLPFPLPPLMEQRRIVAKVGELMAMCDRLVAERAERETKRDRLTMACYARLNTPNPDPARFGDDTRFALNVLPSLTARREQTQQLRQTILRLAVCGKLVPQEPSDEPAAHLLKRLVQEGARYRSERRVTVASPEAVVAETVPFELPSTWSWVRLASLFRTIADGDHLPPPRASEGVAFLTIGNVTTGRLDFSNCRQVPSDYFTSLPDYRRPAQGDILYTVVGATFGRAAFVDTARQFCVQRHIAILKPCVEMSTPYLLYLLASPQVYAQAQGSTTGAAQPTIPIRSLRRFVVPLPPLAEQHRIVVKLNELMAVCDPLESNLSTTEATRSRLLETLLANALAPVARGLQVTH